MTPPLKVNGETQVLYFESYEDMHKFIRKAFHYEPERGDA